MKYKLTKRDRDLIEEVSERTDVNYEVDRERYIDVDNLISLIDDLFKLYIKLEDKFIEYDTKVNESYREHFINEQIDKGMHPHEYE